MVPEEILRKIQLFHFRTRRQASELFAGQYESLLNVRPSGLVESYLEVVASKYTPQAMQYRRHRGLRDDQVDALRENHSIYIVKGGRINVAGITSHNIDYLCDALAGVLKG